MSTAHALLPQVTFEEYLAAEAASEERHEWVGGRIFAMGCGSERHDLMTGLLFRALATAADGDGCRAFQQDRKVRSGDAAYYPDVFVVCRSAVTPDRLYERDLSVVVEVLSPSTERTDRQEKALVYPTAASFQAYVLVDPERRRVEVGRPASAGGPLDWRVHTGGSVEAPDVDLDALYDRLDEIALT